MLEVIDKGMHQNIHSKGPQTLVLDNIIGRQKSADGCQQKDSYRKYIYNHIYIKYIKF